MSRVVETMHAVRGKNPKTVLGFFAVVTGILAAASLGTMWASAVNPAVIPAVPWVLAFTGLVFLLVLATVIVAVFVDPSKLMLTNVSAQDYMRIQRELHLGDSLDGERPVLVVEESETLLVVETEDVELPPERLDGELGQGEE